MDHLSHFHSGYFNGDICSVWTYIHTVFTYLAAGKTSCTFFCSVLLFFQNAFLFIALCFCTCNCSVRNNFSAKDCFCNKLCVADTFHDSCSASGAVAGQIYIFYACFQSFLIKLCFSSFIYIDAVGLIELCRHFFSNSYDHSIRRHFHHLICLCNSCSSGSVHCAKLHFPADKSSVFKAYRRQKLFKLNALFQNLQKLLLCCRHVAFCSSVNQIYMLYAFCTFCRSGCIHGCISAADYNNVLSKIHFSVI